MAIASGPEYSELFRFATVRNPTLADVTARRKRFIELKVDEPTLRAMPAEPKVLAYPKVRVQVMVKVN